MQVRVKIYPASKRLYHGDNPGRKLSACNRLELFQKCLFPAETEIREEVSFILEKYPQHLWDSEYHLAVRYIQYKLFPHPFAPLLASFGMTGRAESPNVTRKHQQPLQATIFTLNPCKPVLRITAIKVFIYDILLLTVSIANIIVNNIVNQEEIDKAM